MRKLTLVTAIAGACAMAFSGCSKNPFTHYSSISPRLGIELDYPAGWSASEEEHKRFIHLVFIQPGEAVMRGNITVLREEQGTAPVSLNAKADDITAKRSLLDQCTLLRRTGTKVAGIPAVQMEFSYRMPVHFEKPDLGITDMHERLVVLERDGAFYVIRYQNTGKGFSLFAPAFDRLLRSVKFK